MKALISPIQNNLVVQIELADQIFEVAEPLYWIDCPDNIVAGQYEYINNEFIKLPPYIQNAEQNKNEAIDLLNQTDWTSINDVSDPAKANPYLVNQAEFIAWRSKIRAIAVNPISGNLSIFAEKPVEIWSS